MSYGGYHYPPVLIDSAIGSHYRVKPPHPMKIELQILGPHDSFYVTTDENGLFLIDEKYRNLECKIIVPRGVTSNWVELDNNYVEIALKVIPFFDWAEH
jgi:hypothetical protein